MKLLGGAVYRDPARPADPALARAMAARAGHAGDLSILVAGPAMVFAGTEGEPPRRQGSLLTVADADLVNEPEIQALTGPTEAGALPGRLYQLEGWQGIRQMRGGFAAAVWDPAEATMFLSVDHIGIKRLYYAATPALFAFASRPTALLAVSGLESSADPEAVYHYLNFGFVPAPLSALRGVLRLEPGHDLTLRRGTPAVRRYWNLAYPERTLALDETCAATLTLTRDAVRRAMASAPTKELGAYLSGGTDSSTVVGLMGQISGEPVSAFSIGFQEPRYDELGFAELSARHFGASHSTRIVSAGDALDAVPRLVAAFDEPFGNTSAIGTLFCAGLAADAGAACLLAGDGGDEIFGGNERYRTDRIFAAYQRVPRVLRAAVIEPAVDRLRASEGVLGKAQRYVRRARIPNPRRLYSYEFFVAQEGRELLHPGLLERVDPEGPWRLLETRFGEVRAASELNRLLYLDVKFTLGDNDLLKVTRTAELAGVRVRFPLLDLPLVEFAATWPARYKVHGLEKRYLFKRAFRELLPAQTLAKRKHGFGVPTSMWMKTHPGFRELLRDVLGSVRTGQRGYFRPGAIEELLARHEGDQTAYYGDILWTVLMLELWQRHHLEGRPA